MMASHAPTRLRPRADPLSAVLATIPSLPRPVLARLTARMIERLDELDGDADLEPDDEDSCEAGEDQIAGNAALGFDDDRNGDDDTEVASWTEGPDRSPSAIPDDIGEDDAVDLRRPQLRRIRATRCDAIPVGGGTRRWYEYRLRDAEARNVTGLVP